MKNGQNYLRGLNKWLGANPIASPGDRATAENLIKDLEDAMGYEQRWYPNQK